MGPSLRHRDKFSGGLTRFGRGRRARPPCASHQPVASKPSSTDVIYTNVNVRNFVMKGGYVSPLQGSLVMYPYPGRRGPAGRLPWAFMSRPFRPRQMPDAFDSGFNKRRQSTTSSRGAAKAPQGRDITAQGKHAEGVRRPG